MFHSLGAVLLAQRGHLFPWVPVALACGIGLYFALRWEPGMLHFAATGAVVVLAAGAAWRTGPGVSPILWALALVAAGFTLAGARAHLVAGPVLEFRYYGPVEGRIVGIDRSASDAVRLVLDRVTLSDIHPDRVPTRVRVALHGTQGFTPLTPGTRVMMTAHLGPPGGPVEPGGFDFQRHAWFLRLGAVGYTRTPVLLAEAQGKGVWITAARMALSARVQAALPGERGAFAAAIMTGDRAGMSQDTLQDLRASNLAHLLAISGLHMGLLAGFVFTSLRLGFAAVPALGLRLPAKKLSAIGALTAATGYLALAGGTVATERAFVMVAVMLVAVMLDRRALSLRAVAMAALVVLVLRPDSLLGPGFQMSFAATTALVAVFGLIRDRDWQPSTRWLRPVLAVMVSSTVAGLATAPVGAAHFNQIAHYGLLANLVSVPLMGVLVMPAAVLAACLMPLGLEGAALWIMGQGLAWVLGVAHTVAGWQGAVGGVIAPHPAVLPMLALGGLWIALWQGRARVLGAVPVLAAMAFWAQTERPPVLIAENGTLAGVMTTQGRVLSHARGAGFVAEVWLENDGDIRAQEAAAQGWDRAALLPGGATLHVLRGKRAVAGATCVPGDWVIVTEKPPPGLPCVVLTPTDLRATGALALWPGRDGQGPRVVSARQVSGDRLWNRVVAPVTVRNTLPFQARSGAGLLARTDQ